MAKGVLGNDPFARGAAPRVAPKEEPATPPATQPTRKARASKTAAAKPPAPQAHPASPELVADLTDAQATPHPASPELMAVLDEKTPIAHPASPDAAAVPIPLRAAGTMTSRPERPEPAPLSARPVADSALGLARVVAQAVGLFGGLDLDVYGKDQELSRALSPLADFLYSKYWRVTVQGIERLPRGPCLIVANHSGALPIDGPMLHTAIRRERPDLEEPRWLVEDQVFYAPFVGTLLNRLGAIRASPENAQRLLDEGRPVIVFPEGIHGIGKPFQQRYQLKRFGRGGFVKLAIRMGVPIIPAAVIGAEESLPLLAKLPGRWLGLPYVPVTPLGPLPLPARWTIRFDEPFRPSAARGEDDLPEIARFTERTRESIQAMLSATLEQRTSVFR